MPEASEFRNLIRRVRTGDESAAAELVRIYEPAIRRAARVRLVDPRLRRVFVSMDGCQSVLASFFVRTALGQYELDRPENLVGLLVSMTRKKLADHAREQGAARRDYRRTQAGSRDLREHAAAGTSPSQQVAGQELLREFRKRLSDDERRLTDLRAQNLDWAQIAADCGGSPEALRKKLARAVDRVGQELGLDQHD